MVNIKAIGGIIFTIFVWIMIANAIEPEIDKILDNLGEKAICPPEFKSQDYEVCFNGNGDVILTGNVVDSLSIETDSNDYLYVSSGNYDSSIIGNFYNLNKANKLFITGKSIQTSSINSLQLIKYSKEIIYLKKPLKTGFLFWKKVKYIPI